MSRQVSLPFRVDSRGRIATTGEPSEVARQHLTTFLLTDPGERVMRPGFGTPLREATFDTLDSVTAHALLTRVRERVESGVQSARLVGLEVNDDSAEGELHVTVEFAVAVGDGEGVTRSTTITLGGEEL